MLLYALGFDHLGVNLGTGQTSTNLVADGISFCNNFNLVSSFNGINPPSGVGMLVALSYQSLLKQPVTSTVKQGSQAKICWASGLPQPGFETWGFSFIDAGGNDILKFAFRATGAITVSNNGTLNAGNILGSTAPGVVKAAVFQNFEFTYTPNTGAGTVPSPYNGVAEIWQEGVLILRITGLSIATVPAWHQWGWNAIVGTSPNALLKDWIGSDVSGAAPNNVVPLGPRNTGTRIANAAGANNAWVPNGAPTNWQATAKTAPDTSSFTQANNVGDIQDLAIPVASATVYGVSGVLIKAYASKSSAGASAFKLGVQSGGTVLNSPDLIPGAGSFAYYNSAWVDTDPNTGLPWTKAAYDALGARMTRSA